MSRARELFHDSYGLPLLDPSIVMGYRSLERLAPTRLIRLGQQIMDRTSPDEKARRLKVEEVALSAHLEKFSQGWETWLEKHGRSWLDEPPSGIFEMEPTGLEIRFGGSRIAARGSDRTVSYRHDIWDFYIRSPHGPGLDIAIEGDAEYTEGHEAPTTRLINLDFTDPSERISTSFTLYPFREQLNGFESVRMVLDAIKDAREQGIIEFS